MRVRSLPCRKLRRGESPRWNRLPSPSREHSTELFRRYGSQAAKLNDGRVRQVPIRVTVFAVDFVEPQSAVGFGLGLDRTSRIQKGRGPRRSQCCVVRIPIDSIGQRVGCGRCVVERRGCEQILQNTSLPGGDAARDSPGPSGLPPARIRGTYQSLRSQAAPFAPLASGKRRPPRVFRAAPG